jgi:ankyrin repeat protein
VSLIPNPLFEAVFNEDIVGVLTHATQQPLLLDSRNNEWDETPLGMALRMAFPREATALIPHMSYRSLYDANKDGESYIALAARIGAVPVIRQISDRAFMNLGAFQDFEFADLDQPDQLGRRALFLAKDRRVAEILEEQYYRGFLEMPYWKFLQHLDDHGRSFLHWAGAEDRSDVVLWATTKLCHNDHTDGEGFIAGALRLGRKATTFLTYQTIDIGLPTDLIVNRQDNDGRTALHATAGALALRSLNSLYQCAWLNPLLQDNQGDTFVHAFLRALDSRRPDFPNDIYEAFLGMLNYQNRVQPMYTRANELLFIENGEGQTIAHLAATLADPFFFEAAQSRQIIEAPDRQGMTPEKLRLERAQQLRQESRR